MIELIDVSKTYANGTEAVKKVNLLIGDGEFVFLVGTSGAGKSSIIKLMMKEESPSLGLIKVNGVNVNTIPHHDIPRFRRGIGVVFQDFRLLPDKTVFENVAYALEITERPAKQIRREVPKILSLVGLSRKYKSYPKELSGGEQQRVAIARALVNQPAILIADEPTGNLDPSTSFEIMDLLNDVNIMGTTVIVSTHEQNLVNKMKKRVIEIENGIIIRDEVRGQYSNEN
ncbi:MAG: cell division ATP-binding protein FtsE [Bacillota bacterium]